jgi:hypothetical protein
VVRTSLLKLKDEIFSFFSIRQRVLALEKRVLASLESRKIAREKRKVDKVNSGLHTQTIVGEGVEEVMPVRNGVARRGSRWKEESETEARMVEDV